MEREEGRKGRTKRVEGRREGEKEQAWEREKRKST